MANKWINVYTGNPSAGKTDGTQVSTNNEETSPIEISLSADSDTSGVAKCAIRCEPGFKTHGGTVISFIGGTASKWKIAKDAGYSDSSDAASKATFEDTITVSDVIGETNVIFWVQASATSDEKPSKDISVNLCVQTTVVA